MFTRCTILSRVEPEVTYIDTLKDIQRQFLEKYLFGR